MNFVKTFPRALVVCCALSLLATTATAQQYEVSRPRHVTTTVAPGGISKLETDAVIVSLAPESASKDVIPPSLSLSNFRNVMLSAIEERLGSPYSYGATGPYRYDCSGFVWSVFQEAGITFERTSARALWSRFAPATAEEQRQFGTLVFFNNLKHVGIVADEGGFYHASTSQGVMYSPFNDYWMSRLDGFRRVPMSTNELIAAGR